MNKSLYDVIWDSIVAEVEFVEAPAKVDYVQDIAMDGSDWN